METGEGRQWGSHNGRCRQLNVNCGHAGLRTTLPLFPVVLRVAHLRFEPWTCRACLDPETARYVPEACTIAQAQPSPALGVWVYEREASGLGSIVVGSPAGAPVSEQRSPRYFSGSPRSVRGVLGRAYMDLRRGSCRSAIGEGLAQSQKEVGCSSRARPRLRQLECDLQEAVVREERCGADGAGVGEAE